VDAFLDAPPSTGANPQLYFIEPMLAYNDREEKCDAQNFNGWKASRYPWH
jgi:hypothetical protein